MQGRLGRGLCSGTGLTSSLRSVCNDENPCEGMSRHATFENFGMAFLTLFQVSTGDNWNGIMKVPVGRLGREQAGWVLGVRVLTARAPTQHSTACRRGVQGCGMPRELPGALKPSEVEMSPESVLRPPPTAALGSVLGFSGTRLRPGPEGPWGP